MLPFLRSFVRMKSRTWINGSCCLLLGAVGIACLLAACGGKGKSPLMPASSGRPYEILVVADEEIRKSPAGKALWAVLDTDMPGLPQSERSFRVMSVSSQDFDAALRLVRNIIVMEMDKEKYTEAAFSYAENVYAFPQAILTLQAPDEIALSEFIAGHKEAVVRFFTQVEMQRRVAWLEHHHSAYAENRVNEMLDCSVWVPVELASFKVGENFFWAGTNTASDDKNLLVYSFPYAGTKPLDKDFFIRKRDSVLKVNIPGAREGMYMTTDALRTEVRSGIVQGKPVIEVRGLWRVKGDFMGGPFVAHARVDRKNRRIVVCEAFVYAPGRMKRDLMRQMEASLYTLRLPGDNVDKDENTIINNN